MPDLPLMNQGAPVDRLSSFKVVWSIMLSPNDLESAETYLSLKRGNYSILQSKTLAKHDKLAMGGSIAGSVFLSTLQLNLYLPTEEPSISKAIFLVSESLKRETLPSGHKAPSSYDQIRKFWAEYRPAAHLWGAYCMFETARRLPFDIATIPNEERALRAYDFFMHSEYLCALAQEVDFDFHHDPWIVPEKYPRKRVTLPGIARPDEWILAKLTEYKATDH